MAVLRIEGMSTVAVICREDRSRVDVEERVHALRSFGAALATELAGWRSNATLATMTNLMPENVGNKHPPNLCFFRLFYWTLSG
jgi:hypothetical protein